MKQLTKNVLLTIAAAISAAGAWAQTTPGTQNNAHEVSVTINKETKTAFQGDYKVSKTLMANTLADRMKQAGLGKPSKSGGYAVYKAVTLPEISTNKMDIYTKVEGKKTNASVIMLVSTGYNNFISTASDAGTAANTVTFLNKLNDDAAAMQAAIDLAAQQKAQQKAAKEADEKLKKAEKEKAKLAKKMEAAEQEKAKASQSAESERLKLENIKGKSGGN